MDLLQRAAELREGGEPFALATVVWRRAPSSGRTGARAIIHRDGSMEGWIGGACAEPTVVREALESLGDGRPRLLMLGQPDARPDVRVVPMSCESEGAMEVYLEPHLPAPHLVVVGASTVVDALARLADAIGWRVDVVDRPDLGPAVVGERTMVVVASQGHYDEPALEAALATPAGHIGLVASSKRASAVLEHLRARGVAEDDLARVEAPAGLDLGSLEPEEMAVAILAGLVAGRAADRARGVEVTMPEQAVDPVCGMAVDPATAAFSTTHEGVTYWFCAAGCLRAFEADPAAYGA